MNDMFILNRLCMQAALAGAGAEVMQAVPTMLELVPEGINKWVGMRALLEDLVRQSSLCLRASRVTSRLVSVHLELQQQASWSCDRWELGVCPCRSIHAVK